MIYFDFFVPKKNSKSFPVFSSAFTDSADGRQLCSGHWQTACSQDQGAVRMTVTIKRNGQVLFLILNHLLTAVHTDGHTQQQLHVIWIMLIMDSDWITMRVVFWVLFSWWVYQSESFTQKTESGSCLGSLGRHWASMPAHITGKALLFAAGGYLCLTIGT